MLIILQQAIRREVVVDPSTTIRREVNLLYKYYRFGGYNYWKFGKIQRNLKDIIKLVIQVELKVQKGIYYKRMENIIL